MSDDEELTELRKTAAALGPGYVAMVEAQVRLEEDARRLIRQWMTVKAELQAQIAEADRRLTELERARER